MSLYEFLTTYIFYDIPVEFTWVPMLFMVFLLIFLIVLIVKAPEYFSKF